MKVLYILIYLNLCLMPTLLLGQKSEQDCNFSDSISRTQALFSKSKDHSLAYELSRQYERQLEYDSAHVYYNLALQLAPNDSVKMYYAIANVDEVREAKMLDSLTKEVSSRYDSLHSFTAIVLAIKANGLIYEGKYKSALMMLDHATSVLSGHRSDFDNEYLSAEISRMACLANTNEVESALALGRQLRNDILNAYQECHAAHIRLLISMASRFDENEQLDSVHIYLRNAQFLLDENYPENDPLYKLLYNELAEYHNALGRSSLALETYLKVERIALMKEKDNRKLLSKTYSSIASIYRNLYNNQKALQYYHKSIHMLQEEYGDNASLLLGPYSNMGISLTSMKAYEEAGHYLDQAFDYAIELMGENHIYTAIITGAIASNASESGDYQKAETYFLRSLKIRDELFGPSSLRHANIYINLSVMYRDMELYTKAENNLLEALGIYVQELGNMHPEVSGIYNRMGILLTLQDRNQEAVQAYDQGMIAGNMDDPNAEDYEILTHLSLLKNRAKAYLGLYHKSKKIEHLDLASEDVKAGKSLLEKTQRNTIYTDASDEVIGRYRDFFDISIDITSEKYLNSHDPALISEAWEMNDLTKSTSIRESLAEISSLQYLGLDEDLLQEIKQTNQKQNSLIAKRKQSVYSGVLNTSVDSSVVLQEELDSLEQLLKVTSPDFYQLQHSALLASLKEVQAGIRTDEILLDYYLTDENLFVFSLTESEQGFKSYPFSEGLRDSLADFVSGISELDGYHPSRINHLLYKTVKEQASPHIKYVKIIPDGPLTYLPFEALFDENGTFLIEDYVVSYAHSISILNYQQENVKENGRFNFAGFAPIYEKNLVDTSAQPQYALLVRAGNLPLPSAQRELREIHQLVGGKAYRGIEASKSNFIKMLDRCKVAHLSMHTLIDESNPLNSSFLFNKENGGIEDLYLYELYNLKSVIELAVLSACETSVGRPDFTGSPNSLSNALAHSGIPATVTSLWKVPDESTSEIMVSFYKYLKAGHRKDESLQLAKLDYLHNVKSPNQKNPIFWAGFVAVGNMDAISFNHSFQWWWLASFLVFMSILLFLIKKLRPR